MPLGAGRCAQSVVRGQLGEGILGFFEVTARRQDDAGQSPAKAVAVAFVCREVRLGEQDHQAPSLDRSALKIACAQVVEHVLGVDHHPLGGAGTPHVIDGEGELDQGVDGRGAVVEHLQSLVSSGEQLCRLRVALPGLQHRGQLDLQQGLVGDRPVVDLIAEVLFGLSQAARVERLVHGAQTIFVRGTSDAGQDQHPDQAPR